MIACLLILLLSTAPLHAQMNIERVRLDEKIGLSSTFGAGYTVKTGNSEKHEIAGDALLGYEWGPHLLFLVGEVDYAEASDIKNTNDGKAHLRYNYSFADAWFWEAFVQAEYDEFRLIENRDLLGTGVRWTHRFGPTLSLALGLSYMYEIEYFDPVAVGELDMIDHRASTYLACKLTLSDNADLVFSGYYQPDIVDAANWKAISNADLLVLITDHFGLTSTFSLTYDSGPPETIKELDVTVENGIRVTF